MDEQRLKEINEELYKRNHELAVRNKTLSLLRELYQIGILTLDPGTLAEKLTSTIQIIFDFELVGIFLLEKGQLKPLGISASPKLAEAMKDHPIASLGIPQVESNRCFNSVVSARELCQTENFSDLWSHVKAPESLKDSLVYPLVMGERVLGVLVLSLNHFYRDLSQFERESVSTFVNTVAIALDKAILYQQIQEANEKLKELDRQKTEFVSIASHQLRSPLTSVKGYASMLLEGSFGPISEKAAEAVGRIFQSSQKLVVVIEDFLNITRIELGTMKYEMAEIDFKALTEGIVNDIRPTVERNKLSITFAAPNEEFKVQADSGKLSQVVSNLIDNAMRYTHAGSIAVKMEKVGGKTRLLVTDTGIGIAPETMPKLFEKFSRASDAGKTNIIGTGLGLYVAKQIVEAHHGKIWAESEGQGKGSTFIVELG